MHPLASIPSPSGGTIDLGPLTLRAYGLFLLLGILFAVWMANRRWIARGGDRDFTLRAAIWIVAGGVIGARIYHVITSWNEVPDEWWGVFAVWKGGLSIFGAVIGGIIGGAIVCRRAGVSVPAMMDAVAPGLLGAQGIGRLGNYFNQELFGKPTDLPWALEIDPGNRPDRFADESTFHPTFLYEMIWDGIGVALLLWIDRRYRLRPSAIFCLYAIWYSIGRISFGETLRVDPSHYIAGLRLNLWISIGVLLVAAYFLWRALAGRGGSAEPIVRAVPSGPSRAAQAPSAAIPPRRPQGKRKSANRRRR